MEVAYRDGDGGDFDVFDGVEGFDASWRVPG